MVRFRYTSFKDAQGIVYQRPIVPISLSYATQIVSTEALLDTGADVNILPYRLGLALGANWDDARRFSGVSGNLSDSDTRAIILTATIQSLNPARMIFVWVKTDIARIILGHINFFQEFNTCFVASDGIFEIEEKA